MTIEDCLAAFTAWFTQSGGYIHPSAELVYSSDQGVHLRRKTFPDYQLSLGEIAISCPHAMTLSALDVWDIPLYSSQDHGWQNHPSQLETAGFPGPEELVASDTRPQSLAALYLCLQLSLGSKSRWKPYLDCLPGSPVERASSDRTEASKSTGEADSPLWWTDEEKSWFGGTPLEKGAEMLEQFWELEWTECSQQLKEWAQAEGHGIDWHTYKHALILLTSRGFSSTNLAHATVACPDLPSPSKPESSTTISMVPLLSRHDPDVLLYPGMDMLNHSPTTTNRWRYDSTGFSIICNDIVEPGGQIWNTYGVKNNGQLLLSYGFAIPDNAHDAFPLKVPPQSNPTPRTDDLIRAARSESPELYDEPPPSRCSEITNDEPSTVPQAHDPAGTTFYIRRPHRTTSSSHPPSSDQTHTIPGSIPGYPPASGIPILLTTRLAGQLANDHERYIAGATGRALEEGHHARLATQSLLLARLLHEHGRFRSQLGRLAEVRKRLAVKTRADESSEQEESRSQRRFEAAWTYVKGQYEILGENVDKLTSAIQERIGGEDELGRDRTGNVILTLETAVGWLHTYSQSVGDGQRNVWRDFVAGVALTHRTHDGDEVDSTTSSRPDEDDMSLTTPQELISWFADREESLWALCVRVILLLTLLDPDEEHQAAAGLGDKTSLYTRVESWIHRLHNARTAVARERPAKDLAKDGMTQDTDEDVAGRVEDLLHLTHVAHLQLQRQQQSLEKEEDDDKQKSGSSDMWAPQHWSEGMVRMLVRVVGEESVVIYLPIQGFGAQRYEGGDAIARERHVVLVIDDDEEMKDKTV